MYNRFIFTFTSILIILFLLTDLTFSQAGTYYNAIIPSSSSFISDLESRIRIPYVKISYDQFDETNIANFASFNNGNGTRSVFCVYSHYEYIYSGTFTWLPMSREHTFCHSWQPGYPSTSLNEYSDQYHLFPTNQNNANGVRSNHPLGNVVSVISTFLEGTYGTDINGNLVYEPRDEHKGDAARAILYMPLRYNGINGYDWTFNWLNNTRLPSLSEGPQDLVTLIQWHKQDPPDKWEVDRNNYIQYIQQNRNPFVDHPEYVNYINFNSLTKLSPIYAVEPEYYVTNFFATALTSSINFSWTDAIAGTQAPSGYLLIVYNRNNYFLPVDGETYPTDTDLSDGMAVINISYSGADSVELTGTTTNTQYYGSIFSYNGSGTLTNYKIDGNFPSVSVLFNGALAIEPSNNVTNFNNGSVTSSTIQLTWTGALPGIQAPEAYLLLANTTGIFNTPVDGSIYSDDTNLSDGSAIVNINYSTLNEYTFTNLSSNTNYYFKIYSYNGTAGHNNYKTDGLVPELNVQTSASGGGNLTDLFISEYVEGTSNNKAIEIYNGTSSSINLSANGYKLEFYFNGSTTAGSTINLMGTLGIGNVFVVASASANSTILGIANQTSSSAFFNGNDAVVLKKGSIILDVIGQIGFDPGTEWGNGLISTADNTLRRLENTIQGDTNPNDIFDPTLEWLGYPTDTFDGLGLFNSNTTQTFVMTVGISNGWNMVSVPGLHPVDQNVTTWWSGKDPAAGVFRFSGGYLPVTTTAPGQGYWMKNLGANTYNTGDEWPAG
ncbi:MAG: endonuclease, partial [Ignavibacteriaceae bacterium]|nr:endonuclease [Ignavibacterium sp.]MCC6255387.1 endonuclease [Ignavibacteriaceae bacterium]